MKQRFVSLPAVLAVAAFIGLASVPAQAAIIVDPQSGLTLDTAPTSFYQQTAAAPCVIGGENCLNGAFPYTVAGSGGNGSVFNELSPVYNLSTITTLLGTSSFFMGLDYNDTSTPQNLILFSAIFNVGGTQTFDVFTLLPTNNNGVGYSDFLMTGFVIPQGATTVQFRAEWFNNDGPDRFFLIGTGAPPCVPTPENNNCQGEEEVVPEPATMLLLGIGLLGAGVAGRRVKK